MHPFRTKDCLAPGRFNNRGQWHVQGSGPLQLGPVSSHVPVQGFQGSQCQGLALPTQYLSHHLPVYVSPSYAHTNAQWASNPPRFDQLHHAGVTFTIIYRLGEGSAGRVVLGEQGGKPYAIKAIHQRRAKRAHTHRDNFLRERNFMIKIGHSAAMSEFRSYLVPLLMSWEEEGALYDGRIFFVMPFYPIDMHHALKSNQPMSLKDRYLYCQELICALCAMRDLGIVHHDIKPGNILINSQGQAYLADFGMAHSVLTTKFETWRREGYSGTYAYMAPEMVRGDKYGAVIDVWSMGLAFLEILGFTRRYFTAENREDIRREHTDKLPVKFSPPPEFDPVFSWTVTTMLQVDPDKRMTARELQDRYVSSNSWASVRKGTAIHDWRPSMSLLPKRHAERCLDFMTFRASEGANANANANAQGALRGLDASGGLRVVKANTAQFEYKAPGAFM